MAIKEEVLSTPGPQYFLTRPDGTCTALIAVDELPGSVRIVDIPANLPKSMTQGMTSLGEKARSADSYSVILDAGKTSHEDSSVATVEDGEIAPDGTEFDQHDPVPDLSIAASGTATKKVESWVNRVDDQAVSKYGESQMIPNRMPSPVLTQDFTVAGGAPQIFGKKIYCTHWLRHGECDFIQQGCLYKHEMPDELTLKSIGIRPYPRWYMETHPEKFVGTDTGLGYIWGPTLANHAQSNANANANAFETSQSSSTIQTQYPFGTENAKVATSMAAGTFASRYPHQPPIPWSAYNAAQQTTVHALPNGKGHNTRRAGPFPPHRTAYVHQVTAARGIPSGPSTVAPPSIPGSPHLGFAHVNIPKPSSAFNSDRRLNHAASSSQTSPFHALSPRNRPESNSLSVLGTAPGRNGSIFSNASIASTVNRKYVPLAPERAPDVPPISLDTAVSASTQQRQQNGKEKKKSTSVSGRDRVKHKRLFIPKGAANFVENLDGGNWGTKPESDNGSSVVKKARVEDEEE